MRNLAYRRGSGGIGIVWLFALSLLPAVLAGAYLVHDAYRTERTRLELQALQTARQLSQTVDTALAEARGRLLVLAALPQLRPLQAAAFYQQAKAVLAHDQLAEAIVLIDGSGQQLLNTMRPLGAPLPKTGHQELLERTFRTGQPAVSDLYVGGSSRRHFVAIEAPVLDQGRVSLALDMGIPPERLGRILQAARLPDGWVAALLDSRGIIISRSVNAARFAGQPGTADLLAHMGGHAEGTLASHTLEGEPSFVAHTRSDASGWSVLVGMRRSILEQHMLDTLTLNSALMATFFASGMALALLFTIQLRAALRQLGAAMDAAADGDADADAPPRGPRETVRLALQFNRMQLARRKAEAQLRLAASVFSASGEAIIIADRDANIIDVNQAFVELTGYRRDEVLGRNPRLLNSGRHDKAVFAALFRTLDASSHWHGELCNRRKDGSEFVCLMTLNAVRNGDGRISHYVALMSDISDHAAQKEHIEKLAYHDSLTHLPNRRLLADRLQQALLAAEREHRQVEVCCLDLDGFKPINDRHGHEAGDQVLREVAARLTGALRPNDTAARLGGDEFVLLLTNVDASHGSDAILERVLLALRAPITLDSGAVVEVSASIGVASYPLHGREPDLLLRRGDQAMYMAKQAGRNCLRHFQQPA
ncbi:diguanylate cyclase domain-containing protein [Rugamonas rubra]|uniref:PAS domain S-box-containing protein/diguanylate cyclase (GGDEF) domain-containing protein n=1 Tax=Rugamonas rubra TaxID=758825 RepID=A0A1I4LBU8_9BURK|nr:diguanylate cyclase [Rugamonas rubra]SFL88336.1 PAS domain S-box-containing protein/diguanylate cyclase (GGDEF) domain-containing protein [Rugamonas rubra]